MAFLGTVDGRHRTDDDPTVVCVDLDSGDCIRGLTGIQSRANLSSTHPRFGEFRQVGTCFLGPALQVAAATYASPCRDRPEALRRGRGSKSAVGGLPSWQSDVRVPECWGPS